MTAIETFSENGFTVEIHYDEDGSSPRDWNNVSRMDLRHRDCDFANDDCIDFDEVTEDYEDRFATVRQLADHVTTEYDAHPELVLSVHYSDHGPQMRLFTAPVSDDRMGSSCVGVAYVPTKEFATDWLPYFQTPEEALEKALAAVRSEVEVYGQYLNGECYGYVVKDFDGEEVDSCWSYVGDMESCVSDAKASANALEHVKKCTGHLDRLTGNVVHDGDTCPIHGVLLFVDVPVS